jgi:hypothetical protein
VIDDACSMTLTHDTSFDPATHALQLEVQGLVGGQSRPRHRPASSQLPTQMQLSLDGSRNFVAENIVDAGTQRRASTASAQAEPQFVRKKDYGRVPTYLHERKMELAAGYAKQQVRLLCMVQAAIACCCHMTISAAVQYCDIVVSVMQRY